MIKTILLTLILILQSACLFAQDIESENKSKQIDRGRQLVNEGRCNDCHTPTIQTPQGLEPDAKRLLSGHPSELGVPKIPDVDKDSKEWTEFISSLDSTVWAGDWGMSFAANLTPDPQTGIGKWNEQVFIEIMRSGSHVDLKRGIRPPMPWQDYAKLNDEDLKAIFAYLGTLKPIYNPVPKQVLPSDN